MPAKSKKVAKVNTCPETIKKVLAGKTTEEHQVFKKLPSGNVVISAQAYDILKTPEVKKSFGRVKNFTFDDNDGDDNRDDRKVDQQRALEAAKIKRTSRRQDGRAEKITTSLRASDPVETAKCLKDIERVYVSDHDSMFELARDKGNDAVGGLVDKYENKNAVTWTDFATSVMKLLHGGENYLVTLRNAIDRITFNQGTSNVVTYADKHRPSLKAILLAYDRESVAASASTSREKTAISSSFITKWIQGLKSEIQGELLRKHYLSLQQGNPMVFDSVVTEAVVNEEVSNANRVTTVRRTASGAAANPLNPSSRSQDGEDSRPESKATGPPTIDIASMIDAVTGVVDRTMAPSLAAMKTITSNLEKFAESNSPNKTGQMQQTGPICFFCQRKGLAYNHSHISCPVRLASKREREGAGGRQRGSFGQQQQYSPGPPSTPPPTHLRNAAGPNVECFRCGGHGHKSYDCQNPCKVCRKEGKGQHYPGCTNMPKPRSGNGQGGRR